VSLLGLGEAQACFRLLKCALELAQALLACLRLSKSPCFVELVALPRVSGICAQIVEPIGWHASQYVASRGATSGWFRVRYAEPVSPRASGGGQLAVPRMPRLCHAELLLRCSCRERVLAKSVLKDRQLLVGSLT
jgi:hypothetical protein